MIVLPRELRVYAEPHAVAERVLVLRLDVGAPEEVGNARGDCRQAF